MSLLKTLLLMLAGFSITMAWVLLTWLLEGYS